MGKAKNGASGAALKTVSVADAGPFRIGFEEEIEVPLANGTNGVVMVRDKTTEEFVAFRAAFIKLRRSLPDVNKDATDEAELARTLDGDFVRDYEQLCIEFGAKIIVGAGEGFEFPEGTDPVEMLRTYAPKVCSYIGNEKFVIDESGRAKTVGKPAARPATT